MHDAQLIADFLAAVQDDRHSLEPSSLRLLRARGFLLDYEDAHYRISDNSAPGDAAFLDRWLRGHDLGSVVGTQVQISAERIPQEAWLNLFQVHGGREALEFTHHSGWSNFRTRKHGPKVSVKLLEPFIARLVKAVSAAGVGTYSSCDGHGKRTARLHCSGVFNATWLHVVLRQCAFRWTRPVCNWTIQRTGLCRITAPDGNVLALYRELQQVAEVVYEHREALREGKARLVAEIRADAELERHVRAFEQISPELRERYRGRPPLCPELCHVFADLAAPALWARRIRSEAEYTSGAWDRKSVQQSRMVGRS